MNCGIDLAQSLLAYKNGQRGYEPMHFNQRLETAVSDAPNLPEFTTATFLPCSSRDENQIAACDYDREKIDDSIAIISRDIAGADDPDVKPILYAPLPRHSWSGSGARVKFSAGFSGLSKLPVSNKTCELYVYLLRVPESVFVTELPATGEDGVVYLVPNGGVCDKYVWKLPEGSEQAAWVNLGQYDGETIVFDPSDSDTYVQVKRAMASYLITGKQEYNATFTDPSIVSSMASGSRKRVNLVVEGYFALPSDDAQYIVTPKFSADSGGGVRCEQAFLNVELFHEKI